MKSAITIPRSDERNVLGYVHAPTLRFVNTLNNI